MGMNNFWAFLQGLFIKAFSEKENGSWGNLKYFRCKNYNLESVGLSYGTRRDGMIVCRYLSYNVSFRNVLSCCGVSPSPHSLVLPCARPDP
jgi:hypothetical protein